jgi:peptidoglycan/LPS O-acetylase OafA/YrhL
VKSAAATRPRSEGGPGTPPAPPTGGEERSGSSTTLGELASGRENNLDLIRFAAASLVVLAHAYPTAYGSDQWEPLYRVTGTTTSGRLAVMIFFVISGFLITASFERSRDAGDFVLARVLRIFPALLVVCVLTALVYGPLLTTLDLGSYLRSSRVYASIVWTAIWPMHDLGLPGVLESGVPYPRTVNASLWTIPYELVCYLLVLVLGLARRLRPWFVVLLLVASWYPHVYGVDGDVTPFHFGPQVTDLFRYFAAGMLLYLWRDRIPMSGRAAALCLGLLVLAAVEHAPLGFNEAFAVLGPYLVLYAGYTRKLRFPHFARYGDFSYGIYIFAFPIQQACAKAIGPGVRAWQIAVFSYPLIVLCAIASWHLVEARSLALRRRLRPARSRRVPAAA